MQTVAAEVATALSAPKPTPAAAAGAPAGDVTTAATRGAGTQEDKVAETTVCALLYVSPPLTIIPPLRLPTPH